MNQVTLTRQQLARIGLRELQLVRGTLRRVANLPADRGAQLVAEVAETLRTRMELDALASCYCQRGCAQIGRNSHQARFG